MFVITLATRTQTAARSCVSWVHYRSNLTPQERHNLRLSTTPVAVISASIGAHPNHVTDRAHGGQLRYR